jgi:uncharacterized membrane protein
MPVVRFLLTAVCIAVGVHVACVLALPRLVMEIVVQRAAAPSGSNAPVHQPLADAAALRIKLPSPDLLYSTCALDLGAGPVLVSVKPGAAYLSLAVFDMRTDNVFVANESSAAGRQIRILVEGPSQLQPPPDGARIARLGTRHGLV